MVSSRNDIITRLGGKVQYEMTVIEFAERLIEDRSLTEICGNFDMDSLADLLDDLLRIAFFPQNESRAKREAKLSLQHFRLFQLGLSDEHFDCVRTHFQEALRHSWITENVVKEALWYFDTLRPLFDSQVTEDQTIGNPNAAGQKQTNKTGVSAQNVALSQVDDRSKVTMMAPTA